MDSDIVRDARRTLADQYAAGLRAGCVIDEREDGPRIEAFRQQLPGALARRGLALADDLPGRWRVRRAPWRVES